MTRTKVELVPWDPESHEQADRLIQQRIACGWHSDLVEGPWKEGQKAGTKCIYWMVGSAHPTRPMVPARTSRPKGGPRIG